MLSLSSGGRVREYLLIKRVGFNVHDAAGADWLPHDKLEGHEDPSLRVQSYVDRVMEEIDRDLGLDPFASIQVSAKLGTGVDDLLEAIVDCILTETTSLGVRHYEAGRHLLPRSAETLETSFGKVAVKRVCSFRGEIRRVPEYEECRRIALAQNLPIRVVYDRIAGEANPGKA